MKKLAVFTMLLITFGCTAPVKDLKRQPLRDINYGLFYSHLFDRPEQAGDLYFFVRPSSDNRIWLFAGFHRDLLNDGKNAYLDFKVFTPDQVNDIAEFVFAENYDLLTTRLLDDTFDKNKFKIAWELCPVIEETYNELSVVEFSMGYSLAETNFEIDGVNVEYVIGFNDGIQSHYEAVYKGNAHPNAKKIIEASNRLLECFR